MTRNVLTVVADCTASVPDAGKMSFTAGESVNPSSPYYYALLWAGSATDSGDPPPNPDPPVVYTQMRYLGAKADRSTVAWNSAINAWQLANPDAFNAKDFGAKGDGTTLDGSHLQDALDAAAGKTLILPDGIFIVDTELEIAPGTTLAGTGHGSSILRAKAGVSLDHILGVTRSGQLNYSVEVANLLIDCNRDNGASVAHGFYGLSLNDSIIDRARVVNSSGNGITLDGTSDFIGAATKVTNCFARSCNIGLNVTSAATDTMCMADDFGLCDDFAFYFGGFQAALVGCIGWGSGNGLFCDDTGGNIWIGDCRFDFNEFEGVILKGSSIMFSNSLVYNNSQAGDGAHAGFSIEGDNIQLVNVRSYGGLATANNQSYAVQFVSGHSNFTAVACDFTGNKTGPYTGTIANGDVFDKVRGVNPAGKIASSPTFPLTGVEFFNPFPFDCTVWIAGAGISNVYVDNNYLPSDYGLGGIRVPAGKSITIAYTGTHTWSWIGD